MITSFRFTLYSPEEISLLVTPENIPEGGTVCTKNPQDHQLVDALINRDPGQWFISMDRDPRDIISSRHGGRPDVYWANLRQWRQWLDNTRPYRDHPRLIEVHYEALVRNPDAIQQTLIRHMPFLEKTGDFSRYHEIARPSGQSETAMGPLRPVSDASVGKWSENLPRVAGQIQIHGPISDELVALGYEPDDQWLRLLDDVNPDTSPGHWPEHFSDEFIEKYRADQQARLERYLQQRGL